MAQGSNDLSTLPLIKVCSLIKTCSCGGAKKIEVFMCKIPDFSLAPRRYKQAGLDLVSAW